ncbi:hypothetical protein JCM8547_004832 [Rhodosporidiobolus lusitaniae]
MLTVNLNDRSLWSWAEAPPSSPSSSSLDSPSASSSTFRPCAQFPSQVHAELLAVRAIPDPFLMRNEELVQWVGESDWIYQCTFELDKLPGAGEQADLVFEGLDVFATVFVNDEKVLEANNMHRQFRIPVASLLRDGSNTIYIVFASAFRRGRELERFHLGEEKWPCWNGDSSRLFVRKAGYNYGWDWGPVIMTAGPYRPVRLEIYESRIVDFYPRALVSEQLEASLALSWQISPPHEVINSLTITVRLLSPSGNIVKRVAFAAIGEREQVWRFEEDEVEVWWTAGLGKQALYSVEVELVDTKTSRILHSVSRKVGFRRLRVLREPLVDEPGHTFLFELNNVPLFIGGSNWIPADSILTNAPKKRYRQLLEMLVEGNQQMVRVWGGGIYEQDFFYEFCDELGILVWQDFQFACGAYPAQVEDFTRNVKLEVEGVVKRLRDHPSLAVFAGNNEDYQIAEQMKLQYDPNDQDGDWLETNFPARELYERIFPSIVHSLSDMFYWPGSPWGGNATTDTTEGDLHCWNVWHGSQEPYQEYGELGGRFVSEFGMQGAPDIRTIDCFLDGDKSERFPQSRTLEAHNKATGFERRVALYLTENIRYGSSMEDYIHATQFIQSEALSTAFGAWRRKFRGGVEGAYCSGALVWQLNDVWPCMSWSIIDSFLRPKPAYFSIKRALAPLAISGRRYTITTFPDPLSSATAIKKSFVDLWTSNGSLEEQDVAIEIEAFELLTGKRVHHERRETRLKVNRRTELKTLEIPTAWDDEKNAVAVVARLVKSGEVVGRVSVYPEPFKFLTFPSPPNVNLRISLDREAGKLTAIAQRPVKGLIFSFSDDVKLSDNALDLVPNEEQVVEVDGLKEETKLSWRYLGDVHIP